eukprot:6177181-Amphidinium_carterae.1
MLATSSHQLLPDHTPRNPGVTLWITFGRITCVKCLRLLAPLKPETLQWCMRAVTRFSSLCMYDPPLRLPPPAYQCAPPPIRLDYISGPNTRCI